MSARNSSPRNSGFWIGLVIVLAGFVMLIDKLGLILFPYWMFRWPMILVLIGIVLGVRSRFRSVDWLVLVLIGTFFLLKDIPAFHDVQVYSFPVGLIIIGIFLVYRSSLLRLKDDYSKSDRKFASSENTAKATEIFSGQEQTSTGSSEDFIDLTTVFGSIKKKIFSKNFKGGQTTNIFGGTDIDLTQADIEGRVVVDIVQVFGGVKLLVPSNWEVKPELTSVFGGIEDKRPAPTQPTNGQKIIVITGTSFFGGIEIASY